MEVSQELEKKKDRLFKKIVDYTLKFAVSDLHIRSNFPLAIRTHGEIQSFSADIIKEEDIKIFLKENLTVNDFKVLLEVKDLDCAFQFSEGNTKIRYRANIFQSDNGVNMVLRVINEKVIPMEELNLPPVIEKQMQSANGLILVTGPTGSGKSTTLSSMVDWLNRNRNYNIITVEDPIEFIHQSKNSIISQRQVGRDTLSFKNALKSALREDPDAILVGELRDRETISLALTAAETGHIVFGTLHTSGAAKTINRIIDAFDAGQQGQIRMQISQTLRMVITQKLYKRIDGKGRIAGFEILINTQPIANLIRENKIHQIPSTMQTSSKDGMITMEKYTENLMKQGKIATEDFETH